MLVYSTYDRYDTDMDLLRIKLCETVNSTSHVHYSILLKSFETKLNEFKNKLFFSILSGNLTTPYQNVTHNNPLPIDLQLTINLLLLCVQY